MKRLILVGLGLFLLSGCAQGARLALRAIPQQISLGGKTVALDAAVWRNFMPITLLPTETPKGPPLIVALRVKTVDGTPLPQSIHVTGVKLMRDDGVTWSGLVPEAQPRISPSEIDVVLRDGPQWEVGTSVDVVAELQDNGGPRRALRAPPRTVGRAD